MASYKLKTDGIEFEIAKSPVPKVDTEGRQKVDNATGHPVWVVELTAWKGEDEGASTLAVSVASASAPAVKWRQAVEVVDLEIIPWANLGRNKELRSGVAFKASEIRPAEYASAG
jgi:hypothetical protein